MQKIAVSTQALYLNSGVLSELINSKNLYYIERTQRAFIRFCRNMEHFGFQFDSLSEAWELFMISIESRMLNLSRHRQS